MLQTCTEMQQINTLKSASIGSLARICIFFLNFFLRPTLKELIQVHLKIGYVCE